SFGIGQRYAEKPAPKETVQPTYDEQHQQSIIYVAKIRTSCIANHFPVAHNTAQPPAQRSCKSSAKSAFQPVGPAGKQEYGKTTYTACPGSCMFVSKLPAYGPRRSESHSGY